MLLTPNQNAAQPTVAQQRPGLLSNLFSPDNRDRFKRLAIGLEGMTLNPNRSLIGMLQGDLDKRQSDDATNRTIAWLKTLNTPQAAKAAAALEAGSIDASTAVQMGMSADPNAADQKAAAINNRTIAWLQTMKTPQADMAASALATGSIDASTAVKMATDKTDLAKGVVVNGSIVDPATGKVIYTGAPDPSSLEGKLSFLMGPPYNMSKEDALKAVQSSAGGTNVTVGGTDTVKIMPDGRLAVVDPSVEGGIRFVTPPGSAAADTEAANAGADAARTRNTEVYSDAAIGAIDSLIGTDGQPGMLDDGGLFSLPRAGVIGSALANMGVSQGAVDVQNTLNTITSNIAFGRLQAMRDASRTGGALGGVSERELDLLANSLSAVKQNTSPERLKENLKTIKEIWLKISNDPIASAAYANAGGAGAGADAAPAANGGDGFAVTGSN